MWWGLLGSMPARVQTPSEFDNALVGAQGVRGLVACDASPEKHKARPAFGVVGGKVTCPCRRSAPFTLARSVRSTLGGGGLCVGTGALLVLGCVPPCGMLPNLSRPSSNAMHFARYLRAIAPICQ
ncbi:hypothetical protein, unlikely [Trypanosoma brucei gambiense DAL972]|uniref:Uncharacterized protein n=1 Tax=Trypanosoma brucei gambiense (strain MHOM/CI/86/DAL972) TaxID=679716 RepID=C9ZJX2_TRYB9|nr:hypothetical protein, unlikely [Trypanosoma brucei gambiense DAL972]CBH09736.1 hypothetical protein, unlikely [Trypanosoma brucei gambiense DAL972]|eukprot:XP_011772029.1 hypothetical protein, unlikely [Trypanosoma brucei gambiense DAL972]